MFNDFVEVGIVRQLARYPVKSMRGEPLQVAQALATGLAGDRQYAFVREDAQNPAFPWLTARQIPQMVQYRPVFADPTDVNSPLLVQTPNGRSLPLHSADLMYELAGAYGRLVELVRLDEGTFDSMPVSLLSLASVAALNADVRRFRPNILVETDSGEPFAEENWLGQAITFSSGARIRLEKRIKRCSVVTVDPDTAATQPDLLQIITARREGREGRICLGVYASVERKGLIRVGDRVRLENMA
jgi:uncharacterized protein